VRGRIAGKERKSPSIVKSAPVIANVRILVAPLRHTAERSQARRAGRPSVTRDPREDTMFQQVRFLVLLPLLAAALVLRVRRPATRAE